MSKRVESSALRTETVRCGFQLGGLLVEWWVQEWVKGIGGRKLRQHKNPNFEARELNKLKKKRQEASLVVQWLRIHLPGRRLGFDP